MSLYEWPASEMAQARVLVTDVLQNPLLAGEVLPLALAHIEEAQRITRGLTNYEGSGYGRVGAVGSGGDRGAGAAGNPQRQKV